MNTTDARTHILEGNIHKVDISPSAVSNDWLVFFYLKDNQGEPCCLYMTRARGGSSKFKSIDAAHTAIRRCGWNLEVQITL